MIDRTIGLRVPACIQCTIGIDAGKKWPQQASGKRKVTTNDDFAIRFERDCPDAARNLRVDRIQIITNAGYLVELCQAQRDGTVHSLKVATHVETALANAQCQNLTINRWIPVGIRLASPSGAHFGEVTTDSPANQAVPERASHK